MQRAGRAAADLALSLCGDRATPIPLPILILAGPGNNGGDAFETARLLREQGHETCVVFAGQSARLPKDAADAYQRFVDAGGAFDTEIPERDHWAMIIDGLFGIGLTRAIEAPFAELIQTANALAARDDCPLIALDCPSGLDADTGVRQPSTIDATHTITFIDGKPGLLIGDGPDQCGEISIATLDLDESAFAELDGHTVDPRPVFEAPSSAPGQQPQGQFRQRRHPWRHAQHGRCRTPGRARGHCGWGAVVSMLALLDEYAPALDIVQPELMMRSPGKLLTTELTALACGPGMGRSHEASVILDGVFSLKLPLVLDADALNLVAGEGDLHVALATRKSPTLLTPHPRRSGASARLQHHAGAGGPHWRNPSNWPAPTTPTSQLKGCGTIVAAPDGAWFVNCSGNPGLATAGSGDVLTGLLTALLAQRWPPLEALLAAVHLHGLRCRRPRRARLRPGRTDRR